MSHTQNSSLHTSEINNIPDNYSEILDQLELEYIQSGYYWQVGSIPDVQGWIFYIPVSMKDMVNLIKAIVPFLIENELSFQIPVDRASHNHLKEGNWGAAAFGKVICIYDVKQDNLTEIANSLVSITSQFSGSTLSSAIHLGGLLYTRYSSFIPNTTPNGEILFNNQGEVVADSYASPYIIPSWTNWPFQSIKSHKPMPAEKVLGSKYYIHEVLRDVPKGRIIHGIYRKGLFRIKHCLIKEGKKEMFSDEEGRDITDRIRWQKELHLALSGKVPVPEFIDYFELNGDNYLVTEFIDGVKLESYIESVFLFNSWLDLESQKKKLVLGHLIEIVDIFIALHKLGYVHRDITMTNFMVDKKGKIYLIDLELSYSIQQQIPAPPFQVGTDGYMSPEQELAELLPTYEQDIYSLGAVILSILIRISPKKLANIDAGDLRNRLLFFLGDEMLAKVLLGCMNIDPELRPSLHSIREQLCQYKEFIGVSSNIILDREVISSTIQKSLNILKSPLLIDNNGCWLSQVDPQLKNRNVFIGLEKGISGIIYLICKAKMSGFDVNLLGQVIEANLDFLERKFLFAGKELPGGLYSGSNGVALAINAMIDSGILIAEEKYIDYIHDCLFNIPADLNLANGIAGYGLALLECAGNLKPDYFQERINFVLNHLISSQKRNGSWDVKSGDLNNDGVAIGLEDGVSGITYFLLECTKIIKNEVLDNAINKALDWVINQARKLGNGIVWPFHSQTKDGGLFMNGTTGIAALLIRAYEWNGNIKYREIAEKALASLPEKVITNSFSFSDGLAGLGYVYTAAHSAFKELGYLRRAEWIAGVFINTHLGEENENYWIQNIKGTPSVDLLTGNGGITYFLLRLSKEV